MLHATVRVGDKTTLRDRMPVEVTDDDHNGVTATFVFQVVEDGVGLVAFDLDSAEDSPIVFTPTAIRRLPLGAWEREARAALAEFLQPMRGAVQFFGLLSGPAERGTQRAIRSRTALIDVAVRYRGALRAGV